MAFLLELIFQKSLQEGGNAFTLNLRREEVDEVLYDFNPGHALLVAVLAALYAVDVGHDPIAGKSYREEEYAPWT